MTLKETSNNSPGFLYPFDCITVNNLVNQVTEEYDVVIKDASIIDGSGKKAYKGSSPSKATKIAALGEVKGDAVKTVDAKGLYASPGWIDAHSHGDSTLLFFPKAESYVMQGVTTFIGGQCGGSQGPYGECMGLPGIAAQYIDDLEPHKYYPTNSLFPREQVNEIMKKYFGWTIDWETLGGWFKKVEEVGVSMNAATSRGSRLNKVQGHGQRLQTPQHQRRA